MDVSVIMTVHNGEDFIEDAIRSVISQNDISAELIIVDDGSTDQTKVILAKYVNHNDIKIIFSEKIGRANSLNLAITKCTTNLIANLDSDDLFHSDKLRVQYDIMMKNPKISILCTESSLISDRTTYYNLTQQSIDSDKLVEYIVNDQLGFRNPISHISVMMRKDVVETVGMYDISRKNQFDYDLWIRIAKDGYLIYKIDAKLAFKRIHEKQSFERKKRLNYINASVKLQRKAIKELGLPKRLYLMSYLRFLYGLLPASIRLRIK